MSARNRTAKVSLPAAASVRSSEIPDVGRVLDTVAAHVVADALDQYLHAKHRASLVRDQDRHADSLEWWTEFAEQSAEVLGRIACQAVLGWHNMIREVLDDPNFLSRKWPNAAVAYRGKIFAAVSKAEFARCEIGHVDPNHEIMQLSVVDLPAGHRGEQDLDLMVDLDAFFGCPGATAIADDFDLGDVSGVELPPADQVVLNAPPEPKRSTRKVHA